MVRSAPRRITMLTGNDNFIWESYLLGAEGALLGACAVTTRTHVEVYEAAMRGDWATARAKGDRIQKLVDAVFAAPVRDYRARSKEVLVMQGILAHGHMRPPLPRGAEDRQRLKRALEEPGSECRTRSGAPADDGHRQPPPRGGEHAGRGTVGRAHRR